MEKIKPKTSTIGSMSNEDLYLVDRLLLLCGTYYEKVSSPPGKGPHENPDEINELKNEVLLMSLKVGERLWYPRKARNKKNGR